MIGYHDHAVNQSGVIHLDSSNWNETFYIPIMASIDTKADGDYESEVTIKLRAGTILRENVKIPVCTLSSMDQNFCSNKIIQ